MAAIVEGFVVVNGDTASASYLNSWLNNAGVAVAGAAKLIGNPTATTGTAGTSNWAEIGITSNLQFTASGFLDINSSITVTGSLNAATVSGTTFTGVSATFTGAVAAASFLTTGGITGASLTLSGNASASTLTVTGAASVASVASTGGITGTTLTISGAASVASVASTGAITGTSVTITGAFTGASVAVTGAVTAASVTITGTFTGAAIAVGSIGTTGAVTGASLAVTGAVAGASVSASTVTTNHVISNNASAATITSAIPNTTAVFVGGRSNDAAMVASLQTTSFGTGYTTTATLCVVTFNTPYATVPVVLMDAGNTATRSLMANAQLAVTSSTTGFTVQAGYFYGIYVTGTLYQFSFHILQ